MTAPAVSSPTPPVVTPENAAFQEAFQLLRAKQLDAALAKVNSVIQSDPKSVNAYLLRGNINYQKNLFADAEKDYENALAIDGTNVVAKFNLAEMKFKEKDYDAARSIFAALQNDPDNGDLAAYKVFLCDLFGGHEDVAAKELDTFNQVGSHASYYFSNAAWDLFNKKTEDARGWLTSASHIYSPTKFVVYSTSLKELGYLPLPPPPAQ